MPSCWTQGVPSPVPRHLQPRGLSHIHTFGHQGQWVLSLSSSSLKRASFIENRSLGFTIIEFGFFFLEIFEFLLACQRNFSPLQQVSFCALQEQLAGLQKQKKPGSLGSCQKEQMQPQHGVSDPRKWHHNTLFVKEKDRELLFSPGLDLHVIRHPVGWLENRHLHSQISLSTPNLLEGKTAVMLKTGWC